MKFPASLASARLLAAVALTATLLTGWISTAEAGSRNVVIEFNGLDPDSGDSWAASSTGCDTDLGPSPPAPAPMSCGLSFGSGAPEEMIPVRLGFDVKIGATLYNTIFISQRGLITFGSGLDTGTSLTVPQPDMNALKAEITGSSIPARPFVAALFSNLSVLQSQTSPFSLNFEGGVGYFRSVADPLAPYSDSEAKPALAVSWVGTGGSPAVQLVIYKNGDAGDFYLNLRYGRSESESYDIVTTLPGVAGFSLGLLATSTVSLTGPLPATAGHFYSFVNGELVVGTPPPADGDSDGIPDTTDNCPLVANPGQTNTDGDGFGDACDADDDDDTVADGADNCPLLFNQNQLDTDADALGDACDGDDDDDGVIDLSDNCPVVANTTQTDSDADGLGDACDSTPNPVVKRCRVDSDNDVDALDILAIVKAVGRKASGPADPRDADGNGNILLKDVALCTQQCTRRFCAVN